jgi:phage terminase large subunit
MKLTPELVLEARVELARRKLGRGIPALEPLLVPSRYKGAWGGRGSGKSNTMAEMVILAMLNDPDCSVVCVREVQKSLALSAKKLLESKIQAFKLGHLFEVQQSLIKRRNGKGICVFQGLQDHTADSIKSLEGFRIAWAEEAQALSERSLELLRPTIRMDGSELWFSWNPRRRNDAVEKLLRPRGGKRDDAIVLRANYTDNPHLPETLRKEAEDAARDEPDSYPHIWLGAFEEAGSKVVIPAAWIESAVGLCERLGIEATGKLYSGLDVAGGDEGGDENAQCIRKGCEIVSLEKWNGLDTSLTTHRAVKEMQRLGCQEGYYDSAGVGEGVTGEWASMGRRDEVPSGMTMTAWNGGMSVLNPNDRIDPDDKGSPLNKDQYANLKAQAWMMLRRRFENAHKAAQGRDYDAEMLISLPRGLKHLPQLQDELAQPQKRESGTGKMIVDKSPDGAKSPNLADSVCIAFWPIAQASTYSLDGWG